MKIGIDIDDTIANTSEQINIYAKIFTENILKRKFKLKNIDIYDPMWARHLYGWTEEEDKEFWNKYYEKCVQNVKPMKNAANIINKLFENNEIIIITARWDRKEGTINEITKEWLKNNNIHYNKLYTDCLDKRNIALENKIDLFIDDSIKTCMQIHELGIKTFIMNSRINENMDIGDIIRVKSWIEIYEKFLHGQF